MSASNTLKAVLGAAMVAQLSKVGLNSGDPGSSGTGELTGGVYARVNVPTPVTVAANGSFTFQVTINVPTGAAVGGASLYDASGNFLHGGAVTLTPVYTGAGQYVLTVNGQIQ